MGLAAGGLALWGLTLWLSVGVGFAAYLALLVVSGAFQGEEMAIVLNAFSRRTNRLAGGAT